MEVSGVTENPLEIVTEDPLKNPGTIDSTFKNASNIVTCFRYVVQWTFNFADLNGPLDNLAKAFRDQGTSEVLEYFLSERPDVEKTVQYAIARFWNLWDGKTGLSNDVQDKNMQDLCVRTKLCIKAFHVFALPFRRYDHFSILNHVLRIADGIGFAVQACKVYNVCRKVLLPEADRWDAFNAFNQTILLIFMVNVSSSWGQVNLLASLANKVLPLLGRTILSPPMANRLLDFLKLPGSISNCSKVYRNWKSYQITKHTPLKEEPFSTINTTNGACFKLE